ncbi:hypothetical protein [Pseudomonas sp. LT1P18]|uniref:hypothetical protein n=1 Tax=Pseudomonas arabinosi TaxID=3398357 RepID=UPI0039EE5C46
MSLNKARIGMPIAVIAFTYALTTQAASDHQISVVAVATHQVCAKKHPEADLSLDQFIALHQHMSDQMADHIRDIATQPMYKVEVEQAVQLLNTKADQDLLEVTCDSYYRKVTKR